jgi:hypothetical protein
MLGWVLVGDRALDGFAGKNDMVFAGLFGMLLSAFAVIGGLSVWVVHRMEWRAQSRAARLAATRFSELVPGPVALRGRIAAADELMRAPLADRPAVLVEMQLYDRPPSGGLLRARAECRAARSFLLEDEHGSRVRIDPSGCVLDVEGAGRTVRGDVGEAGPDAERVRGFFASGGTEISGPFDLEDVATESRLEPGDQVWIIGHASWNGDELTVASGRAGEAGGMRVSTAGPDVLVAKHRAAMLKAGLAAAAGAVLAAVSVWALVS